MHPWLTGLRDLGAEGIRALTLRLESARPLTLQALHAAVRDGEIGDPARFSEGLLSLTSARGDSNASAFFDELTSALKEFWAPEELDTWTTLKPAVATLLDSESVALVAKAFRLQFDQVDILTESRIVTDLRPIFDQSAGKPLAAIVCHSLRLTYSEGGRAQQVALALDTRDIEQLRALCERALRKVDALKDYLNSPEALPTIVLGDDDV